jgi:tetratricopeptide (TPR) repeat protein
MTTTSDHAALRERPAAPQVRTTAEAASRRPRWRLALNLAGLALLASLAVFNAWWYWRDSRVVPDLRSISSLIPRERYSEAEAALREFLRRSPRSGEARMMLARVLAGRGDPLGCARELHQVPSWYPQKAEARLREGQSYLLLDRAKEAEAAWRAAIVEDPLHPVTPDVYHDACQELLKLYAIEDRWEDAYPVMWSAYDHADPIDRPVLLAMRIRPELERVSQKDSIAILRRYVAAAADDWEAQRALARAELALGMRAEAAQRFQACLKGRPDDVRAWRDYLTMLMEDGELDAFLALLEHPPRGADNDAETWMFRGIAHEKSGDWQAARASFRKSLELNPYVPKCHYRLALAEERLGLRDEAASHRQRSKQMNDARAQLQAAFADCFPKKTEPGKTITPELAAARKRMGAICETLGWLRAAQAWSRLGNDL